MEQLSLGELISKCEKILRIADRGAEMSVSFDFEYAQPTTLNSWRGVYSDLALGFDFANADVLLPAFIAMLKSADGAVMKGYKGGDYTMRLSTPVWVANYGHSGNTAVVGVLEEAWRVVIVTEYQP